MSHIYLVDDVPPSDDSMIKDIEDSLVDGRICVNESPYHPSKFCIYPSYGFPENPELDYSDCLRTVNGVNGLG